MHHLTLTVFVVCALLFIETKTQLVLIGDCESYHISDKCPRGYDFNYINCTCDRRRQLTNSDLVPRKVIREASTVPQCSNNEKWNGIACVSKSTLCPGGYQWNGNACIMQSSMQTAALVPSPPDPDCKHAQKLRRLAEIQQLPPMVMPIYSTSPSCPFSYVLSDNGCVKQLPVCPYGYIYRDGGCHLGPKPIYHDDYAQIDSNKPIRNDKDGVPPATGIIDDNKWLQKPFDEPAFPIDLKINPLRTFTSDEESNENQHDERCCSIISPRMCRRISHKLEAQWQCYNHNYTRCGSFCTKPRIQLRPRKSSFIEPVLVMPPPPRRLQKLMRNHAYREIHIGMDTIHGIAFIESL